MNEYEIYLEKISREFDLSFFYMGDYIHRVSISPNSTPLILKLAPLYDRYDIKLFHNEEEICKKCSENGIGPRVFATRKNGNTGYILMERLEGCTFGQYIETMKDTDEIEEIIENIFNKLKLFHDSGLVHKDFHTENIWINKDNSVYLLDYESSSPIDNTKYYFSTKSDYNMFKDNIKNNLERKMAKILFYGNSGEDEKVVVVERIKKHLAEINRIISKLMDKYEINDVIPER